MTQLVTRVGDDLVAAIDELVADGIVVSRSEAVRRGLEMLAEEHRRKQTADAIVRGYTERPQGEGDLGWSDEATVSMIQDEPW